MGSLVSDFKVLQKAGTSERQEFARRYVSSIAGISPEVDANIAGLANLVLGTLPEDYSVRNTGFPTKRAIELLREKRRLAGYINQIGKQEGVVRNAVEVGTGPAAILAIATAVHHPRIEKITAIEINSRSADCARAVVELFGFGGVIDVVEGNALLLDPVETDLMVTETFDKGLVGEPGVAIVQHYREAAKRLLPDSVNLHAGLFSTDSYRQLDRAARGRSNWVNLGRVDLTGLGDHVEGALTVSDSSPSKNLYTLTTLLQGQDEVIPFYDDVITGPALIKRNVLSGLGQNDLPASLSFSYPHSTGAELTRTVSTVDFSPVAVA